MGDVVSFRRKRAVEPRRTSSWLAAARGLGPILVAAPLAVFSVVLFADGPPDLLAFPNASHASDGHSETVAARFDLCGSGARVTCVVDGDTIWLHGQKIRIADIDAPEVFSAKCPAEQLAGERATARLTRWLNAGSFEVLPNPDGRDEDRYGRKLRVLSRDGSSAVDALVAEGVATRWGGAGRAWC